jgi:hypothetical protein
LGWSTANSPDQPDLAASRRLFGFLKFSRSFNDRINSLKSGFSIVFPPVEFPPDLLQGGQPAGIGLGLPAGKIALLLADFQFGTDFGDRGKRFHN